MPDMTRLNNRAQLAHRARVGWLIIGCLLAQGIVAHAVDAQEPVAPANRLEELDQQIATARQAWQVPGLSVAIIKDGEVVLCKGYGVRQVGQEEVVDADTLFAIASNTKAFTAVLMGMLVDERKVSWDDPVRDHLEYFQLYDPYVSQDMRITDLLCHRSGLGTFSGDLLWYGTHYTPEEVLRRTRFVPQAGPFRAHYGYSNLMFLAAGEVIRKVEGKPWNEVCRERILNPLGMTRTVTSTRALENMSNIATPHKPTVSEVRPLPWYNWDTMAAAGGIISSANDMSKWLRLVLNQGEWGDDRLYSRSVSHAMWSPETIIPISASARQRQPRTLFRAYGLGWSLSDYAGHRVAAHGGGYDGMYSRVMLVPDQKLGVVVLTNSMTGIANAICNQVLDTFLELETRNWLSEELPGDQTNRAAFFQRIADVKRRDLKESQPALPLTAYTGEFRCQMYGDATISLEEDKLVLRLLPNPDLVADLEHKQLDTFVLRWRKEFAWFDEGTLQFVIDANAKVREIKLDVPNNDFWFHELQLKKR